MDLSFKPKKKKKPKRVGKKMIEGGIFKKNFVSCVCVSLWY